MEMIFDFAGSVVRLFDYLYVLFVLPLRDVFPALLDLSYGHNDHPFVVSLVEIFSFASRFVFQAFPALWDVSLASILLGTSVAIFLLWRVLKILLPLLDLL